MKKILLNKTNFILSVVFTFIFVLLFCFHFNNIKNKIQAFTNLNKNSYEYNSQSVFASSSLVLRDFNRYNCKNRLRIGGKPEHTSKTNDSLWRIDGAWFICFDDNLKPITNECNVLSFGISSDDSFDYDFSKNYKCNVHSFDPFFEHTTFVNIRQSNPSLKDEYKLKVNEKWYFYRIGLVGSISRIQKPNKIGGMNTLENIIEETGLKNKIIDVIKIDIERGEVDVLENFQIDYACKYYKQFVLETHPDNTLDIYMYKLLMKLDKCFLLFHRDTRFFKGDTFGETGHKTEYQNPNGWSLNIKDYKDEVILAKFIFSFGELYFVNRNFI